MSTIGPWMSELLILTFCGEELTNLHSQRQRRPQNYYTRESTASGFSDLNVQLRSILSRFRPLCLEMTMLVREMSRLSSTRRPKFVGLCRTNLVA